MSQVAFGCQAAKLQMWLFLGTTPSAAGYTIALLSVFFALAGVGRAGVGPLVPALARLALRLAYTISNRGENKS